MLGRNVTPLFLTTITFNPFGESFGFSPSTRQYFAGAVLGDRSWNNSVAYLNNPRDPLRVHLVANAREDNSNGVADNGHNYGGSVSYLSGPFASGAGLGEDPEQRAAAARRIRPADRVTQLSATYDFKLVRLYGQLGRVNTDANINTKHVALPVRRRGADRPRPDPRRLRHVARRRPTSRRPPTARYSLGYDYFLSKNTDIYVAALHEKTYQLSSGNSFAGGVRMRF